MHLFRAFTQAAGTVAVLLSSTALVQAADVSFLTHWAPDTVAKLEAAAATYSQSHPDTKITVRAVPFGDLLFKSLTLQFFLVYELKPAEREAALKDLQDLLQIGALTHAIGAHFPLAEIAAAHEAVEQGRVLGNVVLDIAS